MAFSSNDSDQVKLHDQMSNIFSLGKIFWLPESKIDAFTALAGSGPAFIFAMTEAMINAGIAMGFQASEAQDIVYQMISGSITLLETTSKHLGELKWKVTSPAGTTIAGLVTFEQQGVRGGIINTFLSTYAKTILR